MGPRVLTLQSSAARTRGLSPPGYMRFLTAAKALVFSELFQNRFQTHIKYPWKTIGPSTKGTGTQETAERRRGGGGTERHERPRKLPGQHQQDREQGTRQTLDHTTPRRQNRLHGSSGNRQRSYGTEASDAPLERAGPPRGAGGYRRSVIGNTTDRDTYYTHYQALNQT